MDALEFFVVAIVVAQTAALICYLLYDWPRFVTLPHNWVEERARRIWQQRGSPDPGDPKADWFAAEEELRAECRRWLISTCLGQPLLVLRRLLARRSNPVSQPHATTAATPHWSVFQLKKSQPKTVTKMATHMAETTRHSRP